MPRLILYDPQKTLITSTQMLYTIDLDPDSTLGIFRNAIAALVS